MSPMNSRPKEMTTEHDNIIKRLLKVKALAEQGEGGERAVAERLLASLMRQYNISDEDLAKDEVSYHLAYIGELPQDFKLFNQIAQKTHEGAGRVRVLDLRKAKKKHKQVWAEAGWGPGNSNIGVHCTQAEFIEILSLFNIYQADMHKQEEIFYYAYLDKNDLLIKPDGDEQEPTREEINKIRRAALMSLGIEKKRIYKEIEQ